MQRRAFLYGSVAMLPAPPVAGAQQAGNHQDRVSEG
jgi:hypothetical protein